MNPNDHDRSNGRIFKIAYKTPPAVKVDLRKLATKELVELALHRNDWYVRHARKVLAERQPGTEAWKPLTEIAIGNDDPTRVPPRDVGASRHGRLHGRARAQAARPQGRARARLDDPALP
jgi:hypothetical protein